MSMKRILTLAAGSLALIVGFVALVVVVAGALARLATTLGADWFVGIHLHWALALIVLLRLAFRGALPIRWRIVGSAVIDAPRAVATGCPYKNRCPHAMPKCAERMPPAYPVDGGGVANCFLFEPVPA